MDQVAGRFCRVESRRRAARFVTGLLAELPDKNCWTIAEHVGDASPAGMQHLLSRAVWDADGVRDDVRDHVLEALADPGAILVVDETGDLKKGTESVGVQRQYTGTAGRIENCQMSVFLVYASDAGHALIDRELYLPASWAADPARRAGAGVPEDTAFATKSVLAREMITRAIDAGTPTRWATGDEAYGKDGQLRAFLEQQGLGYVLAVACDHQITAGRVKIRIDQIAANLPDAVWQRLSAGPGAKGHRYYDWAWIDLNTEHHDQPGHRWMLIRRNRRTRELAFYRCYAPTRVRLGELVRVAGRRWSIEESFQTAKGQVGLDQHQVRTWISWYRWTTLAVLAHAFLAVSTALTRAAATVEGLIPLTLNEIRRLYIRLVVEPARAAVDTEAWSRWRREHQYRAQQAHYQRKSDHEPA
ncbi:IS701 family transposase [Kibdelosporangium philippinense]|uniref:IS701 family transposase n=2 Tax=Kibdelosporangium philippinense TaxID=211113 RepID=A0ABS8ZQQ9_9PSEU|nr:IS701 family transposase [Kibdelosporangium philippinense]MCE7003648.1 IS701 family transposase [Kibdelosporangium philippinense]MCE7010081.1 IS701 family transposase [Kibdelosporangium philippinense]